ncbi:MAG: dihydropyrimidinase [Calditrichales bacterium]|nr:MAG: dihydropyrimidinase [Calditrichales bacterium]
MSILIKNGRIITAEGAYDSDIFIEKEKISTIFERIDCAADTVIDARGKLIIPGGIDAHTHLDMPLGETVSADDFYSGTVAAAFGGTTTIIDFPTQLKGQTLSHAYDTWQEKAAGKSCIDYGFHMIITDADRVSTEEIIDMMDRGITSFKLFMAYPNTLMLDNAAIYHLMQKIQRLGGIVSVHAENGEVIDALVRAAVKAGKTAPVYHALTRPAILEGEAVNRAIVLAQLTGVKLYIVHLSTWQGLQRVCEARDNGLPVFAETCPQYLLLSVEDMIGANGFDGAKYVCTPPLREEEHQKKLWQGIADRYIQTIGTDHCPFNLRGQKDLGKDVFTRIPNGVPGIENRLQLMYEAGVKKGRISLNRWVEICATAPARIFGMYPQKGAIAEGSDADLVIWNPDLSYTISAKSHHMNVDYNLYEGMSVSGNAETVISRGKVIISDGTLKSVQGSGAYISRGLCPEGII